MKKSTIENQDKQDELYHRIIGAMSAAAKVDILPGNLQLRSNIQRFFSQACRAYNKIIIKLES